MEGRYLLISQRILSHDCFRDLRPEGLQQAERNGENDRSEYDAQQSENTDSAENGEEHKKLVQFGLISDQFGPQEIVDGAHDQPAPSDEERCFDPMSGCHQVNRKRKPNEK